MWPFLKDFSPLDVKQCPKIGILIKKRKKERKKKRKEK